MSSIVIILKNIIFYECSAIFNDYKNITKRKLNNLKDNLPLYQLKKLQASTITQKFICNPNKNSLSSYDVLVYKYTIFAIAI